MTVWPKKKKKSPQLIWIRLGLFNGKGKIMSIYGTKDICANYKWISRGKK